MSTYPFDVVKTRLQSTEQEVNKTYKGMVDCFVKISRNEGNKALFAGSFACIIRAFPTNAAIFYSVYLVKVIFYLFVEICRGGIDLNKIKIIKY